MKQLINEAERMQQLAGLSEERGKLTTYIEPEEKQVIQNAVDSVSQALNALDNAAQVATHREIKNWMELSSAELIRIQKRLAQIDL